MYGDLDYLEPKVGQILRAPGTDLATISAKRVRRQLLSLEPSLTAEYLKEHKAEIDAVIARVFEQVTAEHAAATGGGGRGDEDEEAESSDSASRKRSRGAVSEDEMRDGGEEEEKSSARPPSKKAKKAASSAGKNGQKLSDEELARKLNNEINGRTTRTSGKSSGKGRVAKGRSRKSAATVNSDGESDGGGERKPKKSKSTSGGGGAKGGFQKEFVLSDPLADVLDVPKLARPQVVKQLWVYIKGNSLQNPNNKREIMCDTKLKAVFGVDKIDMFAMNKVLGKHLLEDES